MKGDIVLGGKGGPLQASCAGRSSNAMKRKSMNNMEGTDVLRWEGAWCVWNVQERIVA